MRRLGWKIQPRKRREVGKELGQSLVLDEEAMPMIFSQEAHQKVPVQRPAEQRQVKEEQPALLVMEPVSCRIRELRVEDVNHPRRLQVLSWCSQ